jgi:aryl carrier-like protein
LTGRLTIVLGRPVRPGENFFEAGLQSATLVRLHEWMCREFGLTVPVTTLFQYPNLNALTRFFDRELDGETVEERPPSHSDGAEQAGVTRRQVRAKIVRDDARA